ncbi:MAG: adenosylcobinamide-phosphate synthase CbiB [Pseudomonadota bacterium]
MLLAEGALLILLAALLLDAVIGDPDWLWQRAPHPVVLVGRMISALETRWNRTSLEPAIRKRGGATMLVLVVATAATAGFVVHAAAAALPYGALIEVAIVAILLAQRSLYTHVADVARGLTTGGLEGGRAAVARIVGRNPDTLDAPGIARAAIETAAENMSDGVVAPALWYAVFGLPGIAAYKAINTADSMVGYRNARYRDFGWAAARLDDAANWLPARLTGLLIAIAAPAGGGRISAAISVMQADARKHASPNAGWPEAAMAAATGLALAGPRTYGDSLTDDPWLNADGRRDVDADDICRALRVFAAALTLFGALVATAAIMAHAL